MAHASAPPAGDLLRGLLPPSVVLVVAAGPPSDDDVVALAPVEAAAAARFVESRRREYALGRRCAREALIALGRPPAAIPTGDRREPRWPAGVVGSITHCRDLCAAAVARDADLAGVGIDGEPDGPLEDGVVRHIATERERAWLAAGPDPGRWAKLLFSVKESVYKALYPTIQRYLDFQDAEVELDRARGTFVARWVGGELGGGAGFAAAHVVAAAILPRR